MPLLSEMLKSLQEATQNNDAEKIDHLQESIVNYSIQNTSDGISEKEKIADLFETCLNSNFEVQKYGIDTVFNNIYTIFYSENLHDYLHQNILKKSVQPSILRFLNHKKAGSAIKTQIFHHLNGNERQLLAIPNFLSSKEINQIYMSLAMTEPMTPEIIKKLASLKGTSLINKKTKLTIDAYNDFKNNTLSKEKLARYLSHGIDSKIILNVAQNHNNWDVFNQIIEKQPELADKSHLINAIRSKNHKMLRTLINSNIDLGPFGNTQFHDADMTPLLLAIHQNNQLGTMLLLNSEKNLSINHIVKMYNPPYGDKLENETALSLAIQYNNQAVATTLLEDTELDTTLINHLALRRCLDYGYYNLAELIAARRINNLDQYQEQQQLLNAHIRSISKETLFDKNNTSQILSLVANGFPATEEALINILVLYSHSYESGWEQDNQFVDTLISNGIAFSDILRLQAKIEQNDTANYSEKGYFLTQIAHLEDQQDIESMGQYLENALQSDKIYTYNIAEFICNSSNLTPDARNNLINVLNELSEKSLLNLLKEALEWDFETTDAINNYFHILQKLNLSQSAKDELFLKVGFSSLIEKNMKVDLIDAFNQFLPPSKNAMFTYQTFSKLESNQLTTEEMSQFLKKGNYLEAFTDAAASLNCPKMFEYILNNAPPTNSKNIFNRIIETAHVDMLKIFLDTLSPSTIQILSKPDENTDRTPLMEMLELNSDGLENQASIDLLINSNFDINVNHVSKSTNHSALSWAIKNKMFDVAKNLLAREDINVTHSNNLAFVTAIIHDNLELAKLIQQKDPQHVQLPLDNRFIIYQAIKDAITDNNPTRLELALSFGVGLDEYHYMVFTTLQRENHKTSPEIMKVLIKHAGENAYIHGHAALKKFYLSQPTVSRTLHSDQQALLDAIEKNDPLLVTTLLVNGTKASTDDSAALLKAVSMIPPNLSIINLLIDLGASPKARGYALPFIVIANAEKIGLENASKILESLLKGVVEPEYLDLTSFYPDTVIENIEYFINSSLASPSEKLAFSIIMTQRKIDKIQAESNNEDAMDASLTSRANILWKEMKNDPDLLKKIHNYPGNTPMEKIEAIEKEIKAFILDEMINNAKHSDDPNSKKLIQFIEKNKSSLIDGADPQIMQQMRKMVTSNEDITHIAWRGYDPLAPTRSWQNLLTPTTNSEQIFTTAASFQNAMRTNEVSDEIRTRVAYAFIANPHSQNFLQQLADMRRAPGHDNTDTEDSPSCAPGAIGRWGKIFATGNQEGKFKLPSERLETMVSAVNSVIFEEFKKQISPPATKQDINKLYWSLTTLTPNTALDILSEKVEFDETHYECRQAFVDNIENKIKMAIDDAFIKEEEEPYNQRDEIYLLREILCLGASDRNHTLAQYRNDALQKLKSEKQKSKEPEKRSKSITQLFQKMSSQASLNQAPEPQNPFMVNPHNARNFPNAYFESVVKKFIEFELLKSVMIDHFYKKGLSTEMLYEMARVLVNETFAQDANNINEKINNATVELINKYAGKLNVSPAEIENFISDYSKSTSLNGLSAQQAEQLLNKTLQSMHSPKAEDRDFNKKIETATTIVVDYLRDLGSNRKPDTQQKRLS